MPATYIISLVYEKLRKTVVVVARMVVGGTRLLLLLLLLVLRRGHSSCQHHLLLLLLVHDSVLLLLLLLLQVAMVVAAGAVALRDNCRSITDQTSGTVACRGTAGKGFWFGRQLFARTVVSGCYDTGTAVRRSHCLE